MQRSIDCSFDRIIRSAATLAVRASDAASPVDPLLPHLAQRSAIVELYLANIHNKPHTLFHAPTIRAQVRDERISLAILFGMLALGARFSTEDAIKSRTEEFAAESRRQLKENLEHASIETVQASILNAEVFLGNANHEGECLYLGIAIRMSQYLRLDLPIEGESDIDRECRLRVFWTCKIVDIWGSAGFGVPLQIHPENAPRLPMAEEDFESLSVGQIRCLSTADQRLGIWACMCKLTPALEKIRKLHEGLVRGQVDAQKAQTLVLETAKELDYFASTLPAHLQLTDQNLHLYAQQSTGQTFVAMHLAFFHYSTLLYFHYLDRPRPLPALDEIFAARCKNYAIAFSDLIQTSMEVEGCQAEYAIVGHLTCVSSSVLLYTLLFGDEDQIPQARHRLKINFTKILQLSKLWPGMESVVSARKRNR